MSPFKLEYRERGEEEKQQCWGDGEKDKREERRTEERREEKRKVEKKEAGNKTKEKRRRERKRNSSYMRMMIG